MDIHTAIAEFVADLKLAGRQPGTCKKHILELQRLGRWSEEHSLSWQTLTKKQLTGYTRLRADLGHSTRSNMLCTLRTFYRWAVEQEYVAMSPAATFKTPKRPHPLPRALTLDQVRVLLEYLREQSGRRARRDEALMLTGLYAGLRAGELAGLRWPAIDLAGGVINIRISKMNRGRSVKIHRELAAKLISWRKLQSLDAAAPVFTLDGIALSAARVGKIAKRIALATGLPFTSHVLRHTFATQALRRGRDIYSVSKALGHAQLKQTEIYIAAAADASATAVDSLPPLDAW